MSGPSQLHSSLNPFDLFPLRFFPLLELRMIEQRGSDELLSQAAVMAPASDNNNQDLATKKAKLETSNAAATVLGGVGKWSNI